MQKFLAIPVTNEQTQLVAVDAIGLIEQASATTVTIRYIDGLVTTITHTTLGAGVETMRDAVQNAVAQALKTPWNEPVYLVDGLEGRVDLPVAVSGIGGTHPSTALALTDLSVGSEGTPAGNGAIAYNNTTGVFTFTPPVLAGLAPTVLTLSTATVASSVITAAGTNLFITFNNTVKAIALPAATVVAHYRITAAADVTSAPCVITPATANLLFGSVTVNGASVPFDTGDAVNFVEAAALRGDYIDIFCDGSAYYISGAAHASGAITQTAA